MRDIEVPVFSLAASLNWTGPARDRAERKAAVALVGFSSIVLRAHTLSIRDSTDRVS